MPEATQVDGLFFSRSKRKKEKLSRLAVFLKKKKNSRHCERHAKTHKVKFALWIHSFKDLAILCKTTKHRYGTKISSTLNKPYKLLAIDQLPIGELYSKKTES